MGIAGELYIGGDALALGYHNRPELTATKFVENPFNKSERLYRTGDLVRYIADGNIEFLGRIDNQVKLRGFRIELPEIEAVLVDLESVAEAVAVIRADATGDPRLVAYVRPSNGVAPDASELRGYLRERLPAYMVPTHIVTVNEWPRTPNGKVDRKALPAAVDGAAQAAFVVPQNEAERQVAEIWRAVLRVERVGAHDNFFDLGGHSLLIVSVQSKLAAAFGRPVPVVDLFRFPTVQALARHLTQNGSGGGALDGIHDRASRNREAARRRRTIREAGRGEHAAVAPAPSN